MPQSGGAAAYRYDPTLRLAFIQYAWLGHLPSMRERAAALKLPQRERELWH